MKKSIIIGCLDAYSWLVATLLVKTKQRVEGKQREGTEHFFAKNESQLFHGHTLAIAYAEVNLMNNKN